MDVRPGRSLGLLSAAHAVNHAFAVLLPLIFLAIIDEFGVTVQSVAFLAAFGSLASGLVQLSYAELTRHVSRKRLLTAGGLLFGGGFAAMSLATSFITFAIPNVAARIGGSPQHPVGNGLLAEQYTPERRGFAISAHIAGGNMGTVLIAIVGTPLIALIGWRGVSVVFGVAAAVIALLILALVRESGTDRAAARAGGSSVDGLKRVLADRDMRWVFLTSVLGGGGRGLGVVNLFALIYLTRVLGLDEGTSGAMYGALIIFSVPMPLLAGWLSDRFGRRPVLVAGCLLWVALTFPFFWMWGSGNAIIVTLGFIIGLQLQSLIYGPLGAFISEQFGTGARYTGASLGYQLATLLGGGFTPALLATLFRNSGGQIYPVAIFLMVAGLISTVAVLAIREGRHNDLSIVHN